MNKFKDRLGRWLTEALFVELTRRAEEYPPMFTLQPDKHTHEMPCLYLLYMECSDPTEYEFANKHLGGWKHWERLQKCFPLKPYIKEWRSELEVKLRSEGIAAQRKLAAKGNVNAAKWLAEKGWDKRKAGTPSKAEIEGERKIAAAMEEHLDDDFDRVFGTTAH